MVSLLKGRPFPRPSGTRGPQQGLVLAGESSSKWDSYGRPPGVQLWKLQPGSPSPLSPSGIARISPSDGPLPGVKMEKGCLLCHQSRERCHGQAQALRCGHRLSRVWTQAAGGFLGAGFSFPLLLEIIANRSQWGRL